jgi:putative Mg2+ transporter-C (MgtC) family protein
MNEFELMQFLLPKVFVATLCGLIVGWERELKNKVAGIRTHIIVCVGACLFTVVGIVLAQQYKVDPTRIIGQIVTGIGFLGAGVIFKQSDKVVGVTSAAFIWLVASIGVLIGIGYLLTSMVFTLGFLAMLIALQGLERVINERQNNKTNIK